MDGSGRKKIAVVGKGNVGTHLFKAFSNTCNTLLIDSRTLDNLDWDSDLVLIAVSDDAIKEVAKALSQKLRGFNGIIAHTAGSVGMCVLKEYFPRYGVFYPLQTFSKHKSEMAYHDIPVFLEGSDSKVLEILKDYASHVSENIYEVDSMQRMKIHIASVFACNFANSLYDIASEILNDQEVPFSLLLPLIHETVDKLSYLPPKESQTGPAVRNDTNVIKKHLDALSSTPEFKDIYNILSTYIINRHSPKN